MSSLVDLVLLFWFSTISRWIIGKLIFCKYMKNLRLQRNITWGNVYKSPFGRDNVTFIFYFAHFPKILTFHPFFPHVHIKSIAHIGLSDILLIFHICYWQISGGQKYGKDSLGDYGDDTSTYFLKSTFPFWKNVHNWLCHLFPSWTLPCIALCKRARLKLEDAKIGPDLPIILTDTRGIANTFSTPWIWIHGTWNVNETIKDGCIAHWETSKTLGPFYDHIGHF